MFEIEDFNGIWVINGDDHISTWIRQQNDLECDKPLFAEIEQYLPVGGVAVDIGAFIGDHTHFYRRRVGPTGLVFAFESNAKAYECLCHNVPDAINIHCALSDRYGEVQIFHNENVAAATCFHDGDHGFPITVPRATMMKLDDFNFPRIDFLKLDVEGFELFVLRGGLQTLRKHRPVMYIEINQSAMDHQKTTRYDIFNLLKELGYTIKPHSYDATVIDMDHDLYFDIWALPGAVL